MSQKRECLIGRDDDGSWIGIVIAIIVVIMIVMLVVYGGMFIGGFYSLRNYLMSFYAHVIKGEGRGMAAA